jgi:hypothetical protein
LHKAFCQLSRHCEERFLRRSNLGFDFFAFKINYLALQKRKKPCVSLFRSQPGLLRRKDDRVRSCNKATPEQNAQVHLNVQYRGAFCSGLHAKVIANRRNPDQNARQRKQDETKAL